jgi:hypothetical protein
MPTLCHRCITTASGYKKNTVLRVVKFIGFKQYIRKTRRAMMTDQPIDNDPSAPETDDTTQTPKTSRFPELEELQNDISRRIRDNQKFLDRFMDDEFIDDDPETNENDDGPAEDFEEL